MDVEKRGEKVYKKEKRDVGMERGRGLESKHL